MKISTVSTERLKKIATAISAESHEYEELYDSITHGEISQIAKELLAVREAQSIGFIQDRASGHDSYVLKAFYGAKLNVGDKVYTAPPAPAPAVPTELLDAMVEVIRISDRDHEAWDRAKGAISACRAAMLQGEQQNKPQNIPEIIPKWIKCSERLPEPGLMVLVYEPPRPGDYPEELRIKIDCIDPEGDDPNYWFLHGEDYEHFCCVAGGLENCTGPSEKAPYTHWHPIPAAPTQEGDA